MVGFEPLEVAVGKQLVVVAHKLVVQVVLVVLAVEPQQFVVAQLVLPQQGLLQPPGLFLELPLEKINNHLIKSIDNIIYFSHFSLISAWFDISIYYLQIIQIQLYVRS